MSTADMVIFYGPLAGLFVVMLIGFTVVHILDNRG